jgi:hypothetical protein
MPVIKDSITNDGPLVKVAIGWSFARARQLRLALSPVPSPLEVLALLDTGAEVTCVDTSLVQQLSLPVGSPGFSNAPALQGLGISLFYHVSLTILHPSGQRQNHLLVRDLSALELQLGLLGYQVVIGRDVLSRGLFLYNGKNQRFSLKY